MLEPHKTPLSTQKQIKLIIYRVSKACERNPELKMAMISVLLASFEVNQIIDKNRNIGNKELAK
jgi:hypothetical protein